VKTAFELHQAWPEAEFHIVLAGHAASDPAIVDKLVEATDRFADRLA
jgi:proline iminopeptidase